MVDVFDDANIDFVHPDLRKVLESLVFSHDEVCVELGDRENI